MTLGWLGVIGRLSGIGDWEGPGTMRLETEFRLRLQLMALESVWEQTATRDRPPQDCGDRSAPLPPRLPPSLAMAGLWVKLRQAPSAFSSDEALLLCELELGQWLAWVPDHGEVTLAPGAFYLEWDAMD